MNRKRKSVFEISKRQKLRRFKSSESVDCRRQNNFSLVPESDLPMAIECESDHDENDINFTLLNECDGDHNARSTNSSCYSEPCEDTLTMTNPGDMNTTQNLSKTNDNNFCYKNCSTHVFSAIKKWSEAEMSVTNAAVDRLLLEMRTYFPELRYYLKLQKV